MNSLKTYVSRFVLLGTILVCSAVVFGQSITVKAPKVVEEGEYFHITYSINVRPGDNFKVSSVDGLQASGRPQTSSSNSIQIINGKTTSEYTYSEIHQFRPTRKGVFSIPIASVVINGKTIRSKSQEIEVVGSNSTAQRQQSAGSGASQSQDPTPSGAGADVFARVYVNTQRVYIGEPIYVSIKLFTQKNFNINSHTFPDYTGFYKKIIEQPQELKFEREVIDGKEYYSVLFQRLVLFPQKSGNLKITPFKLDCNVITQVGNSFWNMYNKQERRVIESKPVTITVLPFPQGKTEAFTGAVGDFTISSKTDVQSIPANEAITYKFTIQGIGNLALLQKPTIEFPKDFEVYEPKIIDSYTTTTQGDKGSRTFEYVVIPRHEGEFSIPQVTMQVFNPHTKSYKTITAQAIPIHVSKGSATPTVSANFGANKEQIQYSADDFRYIYTDDFDIHRISSYLVAQPWFIGMYAIIIIAAAVYIIVARKRIELYSNTSLLRQKQAAKVSKTYLKQAREFLNQGNDSAYYEAVSKALLGYLSHKLTIPMMQFTTDTIAETLQQKHVPSEIITACTHIVEQCEMARYAPKQTIEGKELLFTKTAEIIQGIEQNV